MDPEAALLGRGFARTGMGTGGAAFGFGFLLPTWALGVASFIGLPAMGLAGASTLEGFAALAEVAGLIALPGGLGFAAFFFEAATAALAGAFFFGVFGGKGIARRAVFLVDGDFRGGITTI